MISNRSLDDALPRCKVALNCERIWTSGLFQNPRHLLGPIFETACINCFSFQHGTLVFFVVIFLLLIFFFFQCNFIYSFNTYTTYSTNITLTFTLTIYLLITLLILLTLLTCITLRYDTKNKNLKKYETTYNTIQYNAITYRLI